MYIVLMSKDLFRIPNFIFCWTIYHLNRWMAYICNTEICQNVFGKGAFIAIILDDWKDQWDLEHSSNHG